MSTLVQSWIRGTPCPDRLSRFFSEASSVWDAMPLACTPITFGAGSVRGFSEYFQGTSRIPAGSVEEVCEWLKGCECLPDRALFLQEDFWQHPLTFEQIRKGDCEDHALWAWRKLAEIGVAARFVAGRWKQTAHAWILLEISGIVQLLESTAKSAPMLHPLDAVRQSEYCPALSIDHGLQTYVHAGYPRFANPRT